MNSSMLFNAKNQKKKYPSMTPHDHVLKQDCHTLLQRRHALLAGGGGGGLPRLARLTLLHLTALAASHEGQHSIELLESLKAGLRDH
jgi:hypothetical protein